MRPVFGRTFRAVALPLIVALHAGLQPMAAAAEADRWAALERAVEAGRGVAGRPVSTAQTQPQPIDPAAAPIAEALAAWGRKRNAGAAAPAPAPAGPGGGVAVPAAAGADPRGLALLDLQRQLGPAVKIHLRRENGTVAQIRGAVLQRPAAGIGRMDLRARHEHTTRRFLDRVAPLLGLQDPAGELELVRVDPLDGGGHRLRFEQRHAGLPVWPATLSAHLDVAGDLLLLDGAYVPTPAEVVDEPLVTAEAALLRARASVPGGMRGEATDPVRIVYAPLDGESRLAWRFDLSVGLTQAWRFVIDARTGAVLLRSNRILDANVAGRGTDLSNISRNLNTWQAGNTYYLIDTSKQMYKAGTDPVTKPEGVITIADAALKKANDLRTSDVVLITSSTPTQWSLPDGVSAAYNFSLTYDYFLREHGRNSLDGQGGNITAIVRVGEYDNASWHGNLKIMLFGNVQPYANALDVVGHELTHGLTETSAGLVYELQPGALNESFSDIFGEMVEGWSGGGLPDWKMGTRLTRVFRDFVNPGSLTIGGLNRPYPSKMSEFVELPNTDNADHGGVHINSSIINHCFWQLAAGLPGAIGTSDAARIFFRALTQHLQPQSKFIDARLACVASAEALFGADSTQAKKTAEAFDKVEILAAPETPPPPSIPVVQGPDSGLFLSLDPFFGEPALYRIETALGDTTDGTLFAPGVTVSRPAITGDGAEALFVSGDFDLCGGPTSNPNATECLGFAGFVHSVAVSPDGRFGAFVLRNPATGEPDNRLNVVNLDSGASQSVELLAPSVDGVPIDAVLYADTMTFTTDSSVLIYDALSQLRFGTGPTVRRWSMFAFNLETGKISIVVPPIEGVDTGNPTMGRTGNRYLTFDALSEETGNSSIFVLDLFSGEAGRIDVVTGGMGFPSFAGDESALYYAQRDANSPVVGYSVVRQALTPDRLQPAGNPTLVTTEARMAVVYRRGAFAGTNAPPAVRFNLAGSTSVPLNTVLEFTAEASDPDGTVSRVEFYAGNDKLAEDSAAPYTLTVSTGRAGTYRFIARATDNLGGVTDSAPITVTVGSGPAARPTVALSAVRPGAMRITVKGEPGNYIVQQTTRLGTPFSDIYPVTVGASGEATVEDTGGPANSPTLFYRVRRE